MNAETPESLKYASVDLFQTIPLWGNRTEAGRDAGRTGRLARSAADGPVTPSGREVISSSQPDGWSHLYLMDAETGQIKNQTTKGEWVVRGIGKIEEKARKLWSTASGREPGRDPYLLHLYSIGFDRNGVTDIYGILYKPSDFDSTKKYPIIEEIYPGPQRTNGPTGRSTWALTSCGRSTWSSPPPTPAPGCRAIRRLG